MVLLLVIPHASTKQPSSLLLVCRREGSSPFAGVDSLRCDNHHATDLTPVEAFLQSFLFWCVGWWLTVAFFLHWIQPSAGRIAEGIGWPKGSPFQKEVAAADGAFGIMGIICGFISPSDFWTATAIGASFMLFMMGIGHVIDLKKNKNRSLLNAGTTM
jgi:hypothetical protein